MSFTSTIFTLFVALTALIYYMIPAKKRWLVLLAASYIFYLYASPKACVYILVTTAVSFFAAARMQRIQDGGDALLADTADRERKKEIRTAVKKSKKKILTAGLLFCFGVLAVLKYFNFIALNLTGALFKSGGNPFTPVSFLVPLGISFYTFSVTGYLFDVYYGKYGAERNFLHYALFVSYFPSIIQGPINRNNLLRKEMFETEHKFSYENTCFALQRILWGFLKKLVIADRAAQVVRYIFGEYERLPNFIIAAGLLFYSIQLYADFSGGIDVALGVSELFGIKLPENFRQPYFATSVADFWRRWHITLGAWMKDYIFYPLSVSRTMLNLGKKLARKNPYLGRTVPMCIGNLAVFLIVGIWHGAEWHFVWYGVFHGGIIALSTLLKPVYERLNSFFRIDTKSAGFRVFRIVRTFAVINIGCLLDDVTDMTHAWGMTRQLFSLTNWHLVSNFSYSGFGKLTILVVLLFSAVWFSVSVFKERTGGGISIRRKIASLPAVWRWLIYLALIFVTPFFQSSHMAGFMYAVF